MIIVKQKCLRLLNDIQKDNMAINDLMTNNEKFLKIIGMECSYKETVTMSNQLKKDYKKQGYTFISGDKIYKSVLKLLHSAACKN